MVFLCQFEIQVLYKCGSVAQLPVPEFDTCKQWIQNSSFQFSWLQHSSLRGSDTTWLTVTHGHISSSWIDEGLTQGSGIYLCRVWQPFFSETCSITYLNLKSFWQRLGEEPWQQRRDLPTHCHALGVDEGPLSRQYLMPWMTAAVSLMVRLIQGKKATRLRLGLWTMTCGYVRFKYKNMQG